MLSASFFLVNIVLGQTNSDQKYKWRESARKKKEQLPLDELIKK